MLSDDRSLTLSLNQVYPDRLVLRIQVLVYLLLAGLLSLLMLFQYANGMYGTVLAEMLVIPALLMGVGYLLIRRETTGQNLVHSLLVGLLAAALLWNLPDYPQLNLYLLLIVPLVASLVLPLQPAAILTAAVWLIMTVLLLVSVNVAEALRYSLWFMLFAGSVFSFAWLSLSHGLNMLSLSLTDPLSGAYNSKHFPHVLEREAACSEVTGQDVSLIAIVLDDYQHLTDLYPHQEMSQFLPRLTSRIRQLIRGEDDIFRLREDLLVLVLPNCGEEGAVVLNERISRRLEEQNWEPMSELSISVTAVTLQIEESATELSQRLMKLLQKKRHTTLQMSAFSG